VAVRPCGTRGVAPCRRRRRRRRPRPRARRAPHPCVKEKKHASIGRARLRERGVPSSRSGTQRARTSRRSRRRPAGASTGEVRRVSREKPRRRTEEVARKRGGAAVLPRGTCGRSRPRGPQPRQVWRSSPWPPPSSSAAPRQSQLSPAVREPRLLVGQ